ncbi:hypothetical protein BGX27_011456 [Mortierella sp. AM989]|nr:hypothetical protein BGX27_011456 [Mortierella sp. AM989]
MRNLIQKVLDIAFLALNTTTMPENLSIELKGRIIGAFEFGMSQADIARKYGLTKQTVSNVIKKFEDEGTIVPKKTQGRRSILSPLDVNKILEYAKENNGCTLQEIANACPKKVSTQTIRRVLRAHNVSRLPDSQPVGGAAETAVHQAAQDTRRGRGLANVSRTPLL